MKQEGFKIPKIEYDVYYKFNETKLERVNLSLCEKNSITLSIPIELTENLDIFNSSSSYYNDICYLTTSDDGTDVILRDRQKEFVDNNRTVCQEDCKFDKYDNKTKKVLCSCQIRKNFSFIFF